MTKNKIQEHFCQYIYPKLYRTSESFIFVEILIFSDAMSHFTKSEVARLVLSYLHEFNLGKHQKLYKLQNVGSNRLNVLIGLRGSGWENESVFNAYRHRVSFICSFIFFLCFHMSAFYYLDTLWATLWSDGAGGVSTVADVDLDITLIHYVFTYRATSGVCADRSCQYCLPSKSCLHPLFCVSVLGRLLIVSLFG